MATRYYAIRRPDGSWIMLSVARKARLAWDEASFEEDAIGKNTSPTWLADSISAGYRCCEVNGFTEVENG